MGGILKILSSSEILPVYLVDRRICQLRLLATNTVYLVGFRGCRKI